MINRRDLLRGVLAGGSLGVLGGCARPGAPASAPLSPAGGASPSEPAFDPRVLALAARALQAAREAGASYADVRVADYRTQALRAREQRITAVSDETSSGFGVRVIANGTWGFAASSRLDEAECVAVARRAVALAQANSALSREPVQLAPGQAHVAVWTTPIRRDAFAVPLEEKVERLLAINAIALRQPGVSFVDSQLT